MQIIPLPARVRARLGGLPGLSSDPVEYRKQYIEAYPKKVQPFIGGTRPPQGLRDSDLPRGIKYLDPWAIAEFAQAGLGKTPVELSAWLVPQPEDNIDQTRGDSRKFAAWALMRLGAFYPYWTASTEGGRGDGGVNPLRPTASAQTPQIFSGQAIFDYYRQFIGTISKASMAQWVDDVPNWAPWSNWNTNPDVMMALALMWANEVINERYEMTRRVIPVFDTRAAQERGEQIAQRMIAELLAQFGKTCTRQAGAWGWTAGLVVTALVGAATIVFTGGAATPAVVGAWTAWGVGIGTAAAAGGAGMLTTAELQDLCGDDSERKRWAFVNALWEKLGDIEKRIFVGAVYGSAFGIQPTDIDPGVVNHLIGEIDKRGMISAGQVAAFVARPENDPRIQNALAQARAGLVETIRKTFADTVGCPGKPAFLDALATRYLDNGWTSQEPVRKLLTDVTPLTKKVAAGDYCEPLRSQDPQVAPRKTSPFPSYIESILGKRAAGSTPTPTPTPTQPVSPPETTSPKTGSPLPLALLGAAGGAAVGGPAGAGVGLILGLILGSRKA